MFDLEQAIADWRRQMLAAGIKTPVPLEELENHLREDIDRQMQSGMSAEPSFGVAVKNRPGSRAQKGIQKNKRPDGNTGGHKTGRSHFCCRRIILSAVHVPSLSSSQRIEFDGENARIGRYAITVATSVLSWRYNHKLLPVIRNHRLEGLLALCAMGEVCFGCDSAFSIILPEARTPKHFAGSVYFWSRMDAMAILGGVGHGLEKAASEQDRKTAS